MFGQIRAAVDWRRATAERGGCGVLFYAVWVSACASSASGRRTWRQFDTRGGRRNCATIRRCEGERGDRLTNRARARRQFGRAERRGDCPMWAANSTTTTTTTTKTDFCSYSIKYVIFAPTNFERENKGRPPYREYRTNGIEKKHGQLQEM